MLSRVGDRTHGAAVRGFACLLYSKVGRGFSQCFRVAPGRVWVGFLNARLPLGWDFRVG